MGFLSNYFLGPQKNVLETGCENWNNITYAKLVTICVLDVLTRVSSGVDKMHTR